LKKCLGDTAYTNATSNVVIVTVTKMPTKLTIITPATVEAGDSFAVSGVIAANGVGLGGQNVSLYRYALNTDTWSKVATGRTSGTSTMGRTRSR